MKPFLIGVLFITFIAIGGAILAGLGVLPQSVYSMVYSVEKTLGIGNGVTKPYLEKYEGYWDVAFTPSSPQSELAKCNLLEGTIRMHDGNFSGSIGPLGSSVGIHITAAGNGSLSGGFSAAGIFKGTIDGTIFNGAGQGTWVDNYECSGTITLTKLDPIVDPVQGLIITFNGDMQVTRDGVSVDAIPGQQIYEGDILDIPPKGDAVISLGLAGQKVTLTERMHFVVPLSTP